jgi:ABC-type branched-subunit amino acid transport system substrate-binding protein
LFPIICCAGCNSILGLDDLRVGARADAGLAGMCTSNRECSDRASASDDGGAMAPAVCVKPEGRCVELLTPDCTRITGNYLDDNAIVLGSLFSTTGAQASTNLQREQSVVLAVEEINAAGGIPAGSTSAAGRPLVLVSCDEVVDLLRAGTHLVNDLRVPAIVGPNTSQDTLDLSAARTIAAGTLVLSPTAVASSIADLVDDELTWSMVPSDVQRAPLMIEQLGELEQALRTQRQTAQLRLGVIFRNDALGTGTRVALNSLVWNGRPLADASNLGEHVRIDAYDFKQLDQSALVDAYAQFAPDVIVLAGTAESVTNIMQPLEQRWDAAGVPVASRPYYVAIDSAKVPELLAAVKDNDDLRRRVRGTGVTPDVQSRAVYDAFKVDYQQRFPGSAASISGMGPAYDATYAIAYSLAAMHAEPIGGASIAQGLRRLSGSPALMEIGPTRILAAFQRLAAGESISAVGTFGPLHWDQNGAVLGGTIEIWCIGVANAMPTYQSSGIVLDIATQQIRGTYAPCSP